MKLLLLAVLLAQPPAPGELHAAQPDVIVVDEDGNAPGGDAVITDDFRGVAPAIGQVIDVASNYKAVGGLGLAAALIALLVGLSKMGIVGRLLEARKWGWLRPLIGIALGGAAAAVTAAQQGQPVIPALIGGMLAGLTGSGLHELLRLGSASERDRQRVAGAGIDEAIPALEDRVVAVAARAGVAVGVMDAKLAEAAKLAAPKRLERLAALAKDPNA